MKASLLGGEDMLDARADLGAGGVAAADVGPHRLAAGLGALELGGRPRRSRRCRLALER